MHGDTSDSVIDVIYAAAQAPERWEDAIAAMVRVLGGVGATIEVHDRVERRLVFFSEVGMPANGASLYVDHYHTVCPRLPWAPGVAAGTPIYDYMFLTEREMSRSEFYEDFLAPFDFRYLIGGTIRNDGDELAVLAVHRSIDRGHASDTEIELTRDLLRHLHRARRIERELARSGILHDALATAVGDLSVGLVILDAVGNVVFANREALRVARGGVVEIGPRLTASAKGDRQAIDKLLAGVTSSPPRGGTALIGFAQAQPLSVTVVPAPTGRAASSPVLLPPLAGARSAAAIVYLADPSRQPALSVRALRTAYHLTPAEARLALALAKGASLSDYAETHRISHHTARALLARARGKLGVSSQRDLVRLLLMLSPPIEPLP